MLATMGMLKFEKPYHRSVVAQREAEKLFLYLPLNDYKCLGFFSQRSRLTEGWQLMSWFMT